MKIVIAMTHCVREKCFTSYTIDSIIKEGLNYPIHVQAEPGAQRFRGYSRCSVVQNSTKLNCYENFLACMRNVLTTYYASTDGYILFMEDDTELKPGAGDKFREFMSRVERSEKLQKCMGFFSLYTSKVNANVEVEGWGLARISINGWCGNLCLCVPTNVVRHIFTAKAITKNRSHAIDADFGYAVKEQDKLIFCHNPNLVKHLGANHSTLVAKDSPLLTNAVRHSYDNPADRDKVQYRSFSKNGQGGIR